MACINSRTLSHFPATAVHFGPHSVMIQTWKVLTRHHSVAAVVVAWVQLLGQGPRSPTRRHNTSSWLWPPCRLTAVNTLADLSHSHIFISPLAEHLKKRSKTQETALLLLGGELLAERCRTDDLMPSISLLCLPPCRVNPEILCPPQSFSAKWFLDDRRVSYSQMVDVVRQRWHDGGLPRDSNGPGARRTSTGRTWPFQRLTSSL